MDDQAGQAAAATSSPASSAGRVGVLTLWLLLALMASFALQLPTWRVADWGQFAFYDPGTVLKGDRLLAKGYVPTVDFGYTHGLLSLLYGRLGFAMLGRTAAAFLALTLLVEVGIAWGLARILLAARIGRAGVVLFFFALPIAVMPAYLTLTHPLEAMLIVLALAEQMEGRRGRALAVLTVCVFVKPSMGYVYGALLLGMILLKAWQERRWKSVPRQLAAAVVVGTVLSIVLAGWMGIGPVVRTLLPTTGAKTYAATGFGFFTKSGRAFWWPAKWWEFFLTPAFVYLLAVVVSAGGAAWAAVRLFWKRMHEGERRWELLLIVGTLNTAFLLGFYGWTGSWTYYSYLPMLGLIAAVSLVPMGRVQRWIVVVALGLLLIVGQGGSLADAVGCWREKVRSPQTSGLWAYPAQISEWKETLGATRGEKTVVMTNGWMPSPPLPANCELPDAWFPEPGIPTAREIERVRRQVEQARCVIVWWEYRRFDLWNSPAFEPFHSQFEAARTGQWFTLLRRRR